MQTVSGNFNLLPNESIRRFLPLYIQSLQDTCHKDQVQAGWWSDLQTGQPKERNVGELLMLIVTEVSEAMEGARKNAMDDKLSHRKMFEVELADALIRIFDLAGAANLDLGNAFLEKLAYNKTRADHTREHRLSPNGKKV